MIKALLDTNIILDIALKRRHFYNDAANIFNQVHQGKIKAIISASAVTDIFYILRKDGGKEKALQFLLKLAQIVDIAAVDQSIIIDALALGWNDFEDAVQICVAKRNKIGIIVTRNTKDYGQTNLKIFSPVDFLKHI